MSERTTIEFIGSSASPHESCELACYRSVITSCQEGPKFAASSFARKLSRGAACLLFVIAMIQEFLLLHNDTARDARPARPIFCRRIRHVLILELMDNEGAPIHIVDVVQPLGQGHPARDRIE